MKNLNHLGSHASHMFTHIHTRRKALAFGLEEHHLQVLFTLPGLQRIINFFHHSDIQNISRGPVKDNGSQPVCELCFNKLVTHGIDLPCRDSESSPLLDTAVLECWKAATGGRLSRSISTTPVLRHSTIPLALWQTDLLLIDLPAI